MSCYNFFIAVASMLPSGALFPDIPASSQEIRRLAGTWHATDRKWSFSIRALSAGRLNVSWQEGGASIGGPVYLARHGGLFYASIKLEQWRLPLEVRGIPPRECWIPFSIQIVSRRSVKISFVDDIKLFGRSIVDSWSRCPFHALEALAPLDRTKLVVSELPETSFYPPISLERGR